MRIQKTVFLSYRRADFPWAMAIYKHLTHNGFDVFIDYLGIASGDFETVILENIRARAHFLVILTRNALDRCVQENDWLRREIEESIASRRNIVPLFFDGFSFGDPAVVSRLTGKMSPLGRYNGVNVPPEYFEAAMERLCRSFLSVPSETVLHPPSAIAREAVKEQKIALLTDTLTGLPNLREFEARVEGALINSRGRQSQHALAYLDLDDFILVNESYGRDTGDALVKLIADFLKSKTHPHDTVARLNGDRFGILFESCSVEDALRASDTLRRGIGELSVLCTGSPITVHASIGVTDISPNHKDAASVIGFAAHACRVAKEAGGDRAHGWSASLIDQSLTSEDVQWKERITRALAESRLILYRQDIRGLQEDKKAVRSCELLVRMVDESGSQIRPGVFFTAVSRCEMWPSIDGWVVKEALRWLRSDDPYANSLTTCSINISERSAQDEKFLSDLTEQLNDSADIAAKICFELTESAIVENISKTRHFMRQIGVLGCKVALDDFGTGYTSLSYLKEFSLDFLKIDRSFIGEIARDAAAREIVHSIAMLASTIDIDTVAEGVENRETEDLLRTLGVDYAQGYWISMPRTL